MIQTLSIIFLCGCVLLILRLFELVSLPWWIILIPIMIPILMGMFVLYYMATHDIR